MVSNDVTPIAPRLAVATVSYRSDDVVSDFFGSIRLASSSTVIVAISDNLPQPDSLIRRLSLETNAIYLPMKINVGYGGAINAAIDSLPPSVKWVLISNPDVILTLGSIDALVEIGDSDDRIGSVGPAVLNSDGTLYPSARAVPSLRTGVGHAMFVNLWPSNPWSRKYLNDTKVAARRDAGWLSGACLLVRRSAFEELGGFDTSYFMYFEDVDLGYRFGQHGYRNVYEPSVRVVHTGAHSTTSDSALMIAAHHTSAKRFLAKKYSGPLLWPVRLALTAGLNVRSAIIGRRIRRQERAS